MEETVIEIPETTPEEGWQPPVLTHEVSEKPKSSQRCSDVFFVQYVVCILLITAFFVIRFADAEMGERTAQHFLEQSHAPTAEFAEELIGFLKSKWS